MSLITPPDVQIGDDPTWHPTEWDLDTSAGSVKNGARMSADSAVFQHWTVALDSDAPQVCRVYVRGPLATEMPDVPGITVPLGRHITRLRVTDNPEILIEQAPGVLWVG